MTRRVLLTAAGLTLFAIVASDPTSDPARPLTVADPARPLPAADPARPLPAAARPAQSPTGPHPSGPHPSGPRPARAHLAQTEPDRTAPGSAQHDAGGAAETPMFTIDDGAKAIALTIDDGPNPVYTPQVLALLARYQVTATFSMIGIEVQAYPGVAREAAAAGHLIANHTWTHLDLARLPPAVVTEQMSRATDAIHAVTGRIPGLFRAPYGAWSPFVLSQCVRTGMTPLDWSVDPRDWSRPGVASIVANIMRNTRTGSIILEHDGGGDRSQTVAALKIILPRLLAAGYHFRTP
jgi:peptidoglycan/xylan/chitin deacetylase (PgdA/CDA1 family)